MEKIKQKAVAVYHRLTSGLHRKFLLAIVINTAFILILNTFKPIRLTVNDDYAMELMLTGAYGLRSGFDVFNNIVLGTMLTWLYTLLPTVNWYSLLLVGTVICSFSIYDAILIDRYGFRSGGLLAALITSLFEALALYTLQWTICAYLCALGSISLFVYSSSCVGRKQHGCLWGASVFFVVAFMIRWAAASYVAVLLIAYGLFTLCTNHRAKALTVSIVSTLTVCLLLGIVNHVCYNADPQWKEYLEYNNLRSELVDYYCPTYDEAPKLYKSIGWTRNDLKLFLSFVTPDDSKFSAANLKKIIAARDSYQTPSSSLTVTKTILSLYKGLTSSATSNCILLLFITAFFCCLFFSDQIVLNIGLAVAPIAATTVLLFKGRALPRVYLPLFVISLMLSFLLSDPGLLNEFRQRAASHLGAIKKLIFVLAIIGTICLGQITAFSISPMKYNIDTTSFAALDAYAAKHKNWTFVVLPDARLGPRNLCYSIIQAPTNGSLSNIFPLGGWEQRTPYYYNFEKNNNIKNIIKDLMTKDNYYIVPLDYGPLIIRYIRENYGKIVKLKTVTTVGSMKICKVVVIK